MLVFPRHFPSGTKVQPGFRGSLACSELRMAEQEEPATLPQVFLPEPRNRSLHIYSGLGRWGIKNAPGCIPNYPKIIFWLLKDFQPLLPTSPPNFLFQKRLVKASVFASKRANATANP